MSLQIITNNNTRNFLYGYEVPESVLSDYDHLEEEEQVDNWISYKGCYYHISDFLVLNDSEGPFSEWQAALGTSYFSGLLLRVSRDCETYQIARFFQ